MLERHSREAVGLSQREMSDFITARDKLEKFGETINDAVEFRIDHLERVRRHGITVKQLICRTAEQGSRIGSDATICGLTSCEAKIRQNY